jgi:putative DNA primase/helicase
MALPGSTKWPIKPGRIAEHVELIQGDNRPPPYFIEQLETTYCEPRMLAKKRDFGLRDNAVIDPEKLLAEIGPGNVHTPMLRVIGHCVGAGYADWAIQRLVAPYLDKGNETRTAADVEQMIDGARKKFKKPCSLQTRPNKSARPGSELNLFRPDPYPEQVNGSDLLEDIASSVRRYVILSHHAATTASLWVVFAHVSDVFFHSPRLLITSPQKRCGKTTLRGVVQRLVPAPLPAENITTAALFRAIEAAQPTVLLDEADRFLQNNEELVGVINAGHTCDGQVIRTVGDGHEVRGFSVSCPLVISGIGRVPETIEDRSIAIRLERKKLNEKVMRLRMDHTPDLDRLSRMAVRWADDYRAMLSQLDPNMPEVLNDRAADNWRPLIAIADLAGGAWPQRARSAALALSGTESDDSPAVDLLQDMQDIFERNGEDRLPTVSVLSDLHAMDERPWPEWRNARPITARQLARLLAPFGISPTTIRTKSGSTPKGYLKASFVEPWSRYVSSSATPQQPAGFGPISQNASATRQLDVADGKFEKQSKSAECCGVADKSPPAEERRQPLDPRRESLVGGVM